MTINKKIEGDHLTIALEGRLDTTTAPQLEAEMRNSISGITELDLDFSELAYISSAGLLVLLIMIKPVEQGNLSVTGQNNTVKIFLSKQVSQ